MSEQEMIEGNRLIADFLDEHWVHGIYGNIKPYPDCDALMRAVNKIESHSHGKVNHSVLIYDGHVCINTTSSWSDCNPIVLGNRVIDIDRFEIDVYNEEDKITALWTAIVEFIKWNNQQLNDNGSSRSKKAN